MAVDPAQKTFGAILLFAMAIFLVLFSEFRRVRDKKVYEGVNTEVIELTGSESLDSSLEGKFVYVTGKLTAPKDYVDPEFGYTFPVVKLSRDVEYWQIVENEEEKTVKDANGNDVKRMAYSYESKWTPNPITYAFHDEKNTNKVLLTLDSKSYLAEGMTLGPYKISGTLVEHLNNSPLTLPDQSAEKTAEASEKLMEFFFDKMDGYFHQSSNMYYFGLDPTDPSNGDVRVKFSGFKKDQTISVIAKVSKGSLTAGYVNNEEVTAVKMGKHSLRNMKGKVASKGKFSGWVLRLAMWMVLGCAFSLLFEGKKHYMTKGLTAGLVLLMLLLFIPWVGYKWYQAVLALLVAALASVYLYMLFREKTPDGIDDKNPEIVDISGNTESKKPSKSGKSGSSAGKSGNTGSGIPNDLPQDVGDNIQTFDL